MALFAPDDGPPQKLKQTPAALGSLPKEVGETLYAAAQVKIAGLFGMRSECSLILNALMICLIDTKKGKVKRVVYLKDIEDVVVNPLKAQVIFRLTGEKDPLLVDWVDGKEKHSHSPDGFVGVVSKLYIVRSEGNKELAASVSSNSDLRSAPPTSGKFVKRPGAPASPLSSTMSSSATASINSPGGASASNNSIDPGSPPKAVKPEMPGLKKVAV